MVDGLFFKFQLHVGTWLQRAVFLIQTMKDGKIPPHGGEERENSNFITF